VLIEFIEAFWVEVSDWFGSLAILTGFISRVTANADDVMDPKLRDDVALRLLEIGESGISTNWIPNFSQVCNRYFGNKLISLNSFGKLMLISFVTFMVLALSSSEIRTYILNLINENFALALALNLPLICPFWWQSRQSTAQI